MHFDKCYKQFSRSAGYRRNQKPPAEGLNRSSERTLELSRATLARTDIDQGVRRAIVDAQSELEEALASRRAFPAARP